MVVLRRFLISVDLEVDILTSQCFVIFVMIGEILQTRFNDNQIRVNDDFISKIILRDKELLMYPTTGLFLTATIENDRPFLGWFTGNFQNPEASLSPQFRDNLIFSTNPLRNQVSGSFTGTPPDLAVIGKHHLPIRNDTVRDMMLRFSDYLAVRRY